MTDFKVIASSLEERGFCVIPEFLSHEEIAAILITHIEQVVF